jgi:hypothetical protein
MELTYYDTRPKDGSLSEKRRDKERAEQGRVSSSNNDGAASRKLGPREVKRRPLPTDPSMSAPVGRSPPPEQVYSAPLPQLHQNDPIYNTQQEYDDQWAPDSHCHVLTAAEIPLYDEPLSDDRFDHSFTHSHNEYRQPREGSQSDMIRPPPSSYDNLDRSGELLESDNFDFRSAQSSLPVTPAQPSQHTSFAAESHHRAQSSDSAPNRSSPYSAIAAYGSSPPSFNHDGCGPGSADHQHQTSFRRYSTSPTKNDVFRDSPLRHSMSQHDVEPGFPAQYDISEDEGPPPPPPAHRSNLQRSASPPDGRQDMQPVKMPQSLNLGSTSRRMSPFDRSPLQSIERNYAPDYQGSVKSLPPSPEKEHTYSPYSKPTYSPVALQARKNSYDRHNSGIENTPPSLRSGYGRAREETEDSWMQTERHGHRQSTAHRESLRNRDMSPLDHVSSPYQPPHVEDERQPFASEPLIIKPRAASPDQRAILRKAVSPQPVENPSEQRLSGVPFGPDSYEIFNPSSPLSSSVAGPESRYETPEQAKELARQHEVQKLRDQGPIIGNDGRVIDPTDHLPTDTWAPEPERKNRKPEMVIRYKTKENISRTPRGYGSSPGAARPHSIAGPFYGSSPSAVESPTGLLQQQKNGRNRLQKQMPGRPLPVQPYQQTHSSPAVPIAHHNTPSPRANYPSRPDLSEHPLSGQPSQGHSRGGSLGGPYGGAPPIPAKVPISPMSSNHRYAGYGAMDALSAELSMIDLGPSGDGRGGRTRRGYGL